MLLVLDDRVTALAEVVDLDPRRWCLCDAQLKVVYARVAVHTLVEWQLLAPGDFRALDALGSRAYCSLGCDGG